MARRLPLYALIWLAWLLPAVALCADDGPWTLLAGYSFDDDRIDSGPDTFRIFNNAKGTVGLCSDIRYSGYYAVEIRDVARDSDFPELQGYFQMMDSGTLHAHFALLVADPYQELNIALAGPAGFRLGRDGIAFWLSTRDGRLVHTSDSIPKPLLTLTPYAWYRVDLQYDIDRGSYDLRILEEGQEPPRVDLRDQPNAASQVGSAVDKFSFVGDLGKDVSSAAYYVDDIIIGVGKEMALAPFVAPGRRKLFIDRWWEYQTLLQSELRCLPAQGPEDFGISGTELWRVLGDQGRTAFRRMLEQDDRDLLGLPPLAAGWARGIGDWKKGCELLQRKQPRAAMAAFEEAAVPLFGSKVVDLSLTMALAQAGRWGEVGERLAAESPEWEGDARFDLIVGRIAVARGDPALSQPHWRGYLDALQSVEQGAIENPYDGRPQQNDATPELLAKRASTAAQQSVLEQNLFLLLWEQRYGEAADLAREVADHFSARPRLLARWLEHQGDATFLDGDYGTAIAVYKRSVQLWPAECSSALAKLSDLYFLLGDMARERQYRERIYGALRPVEQLSQD